MGDPLGELEDSLAYMFELQTENKGGYINPLVKKLRRELDHYKEDSSSNSLKSLIDAFNNAMPVIENYYADSYEVKLKIGALAGTDGKSFGWHKSNQPSRHTFFQPTAVKPNTKTDLIPWLSSRIAKDFTSLDSQTQVQVLIDNKSEKECVVKLKLHLHANPAFLTHLAMDSPKTFVKLMGSSLGFKLEKQQIAKIINHHSATMFTEFADPFERVEKLVDYLNKKLPPLYSINKLLEDPKAKAVLDQSELLQLYQSDEFKTRQDYETSPNSTSYTP